MITFAKFTRQRGSKGNGTSLFLANAGLLLVLGGVVWLPRSPGTVAVPSSATIITRLTEFPMVERASPLEQAAADRGEQAAQHLQAGNEEAARMILAQIVSKPIIVQDRSIGYGALQDSASLGVYFRLAKTLDRCARRAAEQGNYRAAREYIGWCRRLRQKTLADALPANNNDQLAEFLQKHGDAAEAALNRCCQARLQDVQERKKQRK